MPHENGGPFGALLRDWRRLRGTSQLGLANEAGTSTRHLSFLETGRASPSREMVLRLANALDVPLRERNALLVAAGFAPVYRETDLDAPDMGPLRRMLRFLLAAHEPFPAVLIDHCGGVIEPNAACARMLARLLPPPTAASAAERPNLHRLTFAEDGLRHVLVNWEEVAATLLSRLQREALTSPAGDPLRSLVEELLALPCVPESWRFPDLRQAPALVLPLHLKNADFELRLFSTLTTVGTPLDVTAQELRIESFLPADPATEQTLRAMAEAAG